MYIDIGNLYGIGGLVRTQSIIRGERQHGNRPVIRTGAGGKCRFFYGIDIDRFQDKIIVVNQVGIIIDDIGTAGGLSV